MMVSQSALANAWRLPKRLAYVVDHSLPYSSDGYAIRTHEVARALVKSGIDVVVFNRPGRPWDIPDFHSKDSVPLDVTIEDVRYVFLPFFGRPELEWRDRLRLTERVLLEAMEIFRPTAVMAASNWENAKPAVFSARKLGIPFFYEVRGFWELSRAANEPSYQDTNEFATHQKQEAQVANAAKGVFTLTEGMRSELIKRGVAAEKICLVPNGVRSNPSPVPIIRRSDIGCIARHLLGYIGSLASYEGVDDLIRLVALMREQGTDVAAMIVGSAAPAGIMGRKRLGPAEVTLRDLARDLGVEMNVHFIPQISWDRVGSYYALCDAIIMPRRDTAVTKVVAPLKPYAAAPFGVPVFMTDIPPLRQVAADIRGSLFPEGDLTTLSAQLHHAFKNGHPAVMEPLPRGIYWQDRVQPITNMFGTVSAAESARRPTQPVTTSTNPLALPSFDLAVVPAVAMNRHSTLPIAGIGPCHEQRTSSAFFVPLTRNNVLSHLGAAVPGIFLIDWVGLQSRQQNLIDEKDEWADLWSIHNMRLNRQIMDACRIANDRGWKLNVIGPVHRSSAPLFRVVAGLFEVIYPHAAEVSS